MEDVQKKKDIPLVVFNESTTYAIDTINLSLMVQGATHMVNFMTMDVTIH